MASAAEQMAANLSWSTFGKAKDLQNRIWFTLGLLIIYRLGTYIPMPGIDPVELSRFIEQTSSGILGVFNMFAGGAVSRMAIFALGIMPYISASIIMQLLTSMVPELEKLKKEGESGRRKINQYTRYGTVVLATVQAYGIAVGMEAQGLATDPGWFFRATAVITLVGGTMFLMWLGEQITARGIGNGISLIIYVGIVAELPAALAQFFELGRTGQLSVAAMLAVLIGAVAVIAGVVFVERAQRRILVQYPRRQVGMKMFGGENSFLPLKVNTAGVIPPIFASSLLLMPATIASFSADGGAGGIMSYVAAYMGRGQPLYLITFVALIVFFAFFYTAVVFNPDEVAENLKRNGGYVPGIRPGKKTAEYLDYVLNRLTVIGAGYLALICLLPEFLISELGVPFYFGGTSLLIVVSVTMDTVTQVQSHLLAHQYEGLIERSKLRGKGKKGKAGARKR
ncbi:preprotein translocase subunit SecY [Oceanicella actignis]|uniref:Protein translocase subunit SecY n=1 Tax=Oceanicella actignis TaxID=1189325 RepID=A0A1M7TLE7_9RHOB|nr:preprotein translocase subunit SecY [Oceanicella actignis]TYO88293.1 protein translocase subunit secY/sec61 alpha [Oceanicella actignis]SET69417.1 protein translocase subunit secY/sec61 alpha [Oceanicella actignis]SHN71468.1 protein translocase subunit secY/sec61 alpha [Oceanicella actignis]